MRVRANNEKPTSGALSLFLRESADDVKEGWEASSIAGTCRCIIPAGFNVLTYCG